MIMKKRTFLSVILILLVLCGLRAERPVYRGFVDTGYNFGGPTGAVAHWTLNTTHGVEFIPGRLFVGGGVGVGISTENDRANCYSLPLYAAARYTFGGHRVEPYIDMKAGYAFLWDRERETGKNIGGFYFAPSAGISLPLTTATAVFFGLGYELHNARYTYRGDTNSFNAGGFSLIAGVKF